MNLRKIYEYYSREDVKKFIFEFSKNREVTGVFRSGGFSQRPNVIQYPDDILAMAKTGIIEFHGSLEHWSQPMNLKSDNYEQLRTGWDLILDVDCKLFEHGKIASEAFLRGIRRHEINNASIKFTGGTGFHIGIPWESFPKEIDYKSTVKKYPDLARIIARYLKEFVRERFERNILKQFSVEDLSHQVNKPIGEIFTEDGIDPFQIVDVDPILISPRHFFRLPYSLNRKTFLVSVPIKHGDLENFKKMDAKPEGLKVSEGFLDRHEEGEANTLVIQASEWWGRISRSEKDKILDKEFERARKRGFYWIKRAEIKKFKKTGIKGEIKTSVSKKLFPPCIKNISKGLPDGRKRSLFVLINFLRSSNWTWEDIEKYIFEWNENNKPPLRENLIRSHIRWSRNRNESIPPPNCFKDDAKEEGYYKDFDVCEPDNRCKAIKNPVTYARSMIKKGKIRKSPSKQRTSSTRKGG